MPTPAQWEGRTKPSLVDWSFACTWAKSQGHVTYSIVITYFLSSLNPEALPSLCCWTTTNSKTSPQTQQAKRSQVLIPQGRAEERRICKQAGHCTQEEEFPTRNQVPTFLTHPWSSSITAGPQHHPRALPSRSWPQHPRHQEQGQNKWGG